MRKNHGPRKIGYLAPQFPIDEIRDPAQKDARRSQGDHDVTSSKERRRRGSGGEIDADGAADEPPMTRHPALPDIKERERIASEARQVVKQHVAEPAPHENPDRNTERGRPFAVRHPRDNDLVESKKRVTTRR